MGRTSPMPNLIINKRAMEPSFINRSSTLLKIIRDATEHFQITALSRQLEAAEELLQDSQLLDVVILGQFKAGKTSFINSLIGSSVLPVGVIPVTTVITRITRIQYGEQERAIVTCLDGSTKEIPLDTVDEYISEAKNPANQKNVAVVDVELPLFEHYHGLRLVDTPGLGSAFKYNTATSENWLPRVGAAIVAISADRPLSESDIGLLRELEQYTPEIVLLLTKADLLAEDQQQEVIQFFEQTAERELKRTYPIFLYSIKAATDQYRQRLDAELFIPLSNNAAAEFYKIAQHKLFKLRESCMRYLEIALKVSQQADHDRESVKALMLDERVNYDFIRSELNLIAREQKIKTRDHIIGHLYKTCRSQLIQKIMSDLNQAMRSWKGSLWTFTRQYETWIEETMKRVLQETSHAEQKHFFETIHQAQAGIERTLKLFKSHLDLNIEKVLGVRLHEAAWDITVATPARPDVVFARSFDFHLDLLWFLIPMFIFRKAFEKHFLHQIPWSVEVNLSRLAHQWEVGINKAIDEVKNQALVYVQEELATVERLLSQEQGHTEEIIKTMDQINLHLNSLT
ncbi:MAG: dynamin family protein [Deltaproteobacteria bacterium]|nr:dynamin family protein [Deltaproteobacteria bacterium]